MLTCPYKALTGFDCFGCGMQRAFVELLKGNFSQSIHLYPALLPIIFTLLLTGLHLKFSFEKGADYIKYSFITSAAIVVISYIIKFV